LPTTRNDGRPLLIGRELSWRTLEGDVMTLPRIAFRR
jgi:hypothetical protein